MKDGIAIPGEPIAGKPLEFGQQEGAGLSFGAEEYFGIQLFEQKLVAGQEAAVKHRQMEFSVVLFDTAALFHRASGRAHTETQVPQGAGEFRDQWPKFGFRLFIAEKKQEIKVRVREKHFAAVATQRQ